MNSTDTGNARRARPAEICICLALNSTPFSHSSHCQLTARADAAKVDFRAHSLRVARDSSWDSNWNAACPNGKLSRGPVFAVHFTVNCYGSVWCSLFAAVAVRATARSNKQQYVYSIVP